MPVTVKILDRCGEITNSREVAPDTSYPFAFFHQQYGCKVNLPRVALIGCQKNDTVGYAYMLELEEVEIRNRRIVVSTSALEGKEPDVFRMGADYIISAITNDGYPRLLVASHMDEWATGLEGVIPTASATQLKG